MTYASLLRAESARHRHIPELMSDVNSIDLENSTFGVITHALVGSGQWVFLVINVAWSGTYSLNSINLVISGSRIRPVGSAGRGQENGHVE